jgi:2,4-dienoyl-CoA reductase-like NADH-dependent reductase (Old Yellow Enzyme family)
VRLPLEVYRAVRQAVNERLVVGCRFLSEECIPGGYTAEDAAWFGAELARAGMDYLSLSRGGKFEDAKQPRIGWARYPYTGPSGYECMPTVRSDERGPFGRNRAATSAVRAAVRAAGLPTPVVLSGGISTFEQAEELLRAGDADIVASARQSLADPDWFRKLRLGLGSEVRRCVFTNYCEGLDQVHKPVTCKLWDHADLDGEGTRLTPDGRRRLVAPPWEPAAR